jgi:anti-sigma B factor antagonist
MIITKTQHNGSITIALDGRMDITTAPDLEREIKNLDSGVTELIMDFENRFR